MLVSSWTYIRGASNWDRYFYNLKLNINQFDDLTGLRNSKKIISVITMQSLLGKTTFFVD